MFVSRRRRSGNRYTFAVILMILGIMYIMGRISPQKEVEFPVMLQYNGYSYQYTETFKGSPFMFKRVRPSTAEGFLILARRGVEADQEIYIYEGNLRYRRYEALKE